MTPKFKPGDKVTFLRDFSSLFGGMDYKQGTVCTVKDYSLDNETVTLKEAPSRWFNDNLFKEVRKFIRLEDVD